MNIRHVSETVCQPLATRPPKLVSRAATGSVWKVCGSNSVAEGDDLIFGDDAIAEIPDIAGMEVFQIKHGVP
jgi:hypothetical protein